MAICADSVSPTSWAVAGQATYPCANPGQVVVVSQSDWSQYQMSYDNSLVQIGFMGAVLCWVTGLVVGFVISVVRKARFP